MTKRRQSGLFFPLLICQMQITIFGKLTFGSLKKEIKMCDSCGCTPPEKPIEDEVCSGCGKPKAECICEQEEK